MYMVSRIFVILTLMTWVLAGQNGASQPIYAASADLVTIITVTTTNDELNNDGDCSLREAIQAANQNTVVDNCAAGVGDDEINLPAGTYTLTLPGDNEENNASGDLDIQSNLTINGAGAISTTIDGNALDRVLDIPLNQVRVIVKNLTVANGLAKFDGGGIRNNGALTLMHSIISTNKAYYGGGIYNESTLSMIDSIIRNNHAVDFNSFGGGIANRGTLTMTNSTISDNTSIRYAGGFNNDGTATLTAVTISRNRASEQGGGILNSGDLVLTNSTMEGNGADTIIGGGAISTFGPLTLTNSTLSGNIAGHAAGIYVQLHTVTLNHSTITANRARGGSVGGIQSGFQATVILANSIVANQLQGKDCLPESVIASVGYNLDSDNSCNLTEASDIPGVNAQLGPLQDNGGPTWTHALLPGSVAIDHGDCLGGTLTTDQRGVVRPQGAACDIGSYETTGAAIAIHVTPEIQTIARGDTATFTLTITNTGSITLTNITVVDNRASTCEPVVDNLSPLAATVYHCNLSAVMTPFPNRVVVTALTLLGDRVHVVGTAVIRLIGWSDTFLPVVIDTRQTRQQR